MLIETPGTSYSSPSRKVKKQVNYAESDSEQDEGDVFKPLSGNGRAAKRRRISVKDESDDEFGFDAATQAAMDSDDGMLPFHSFSKIYLPVCRSAQELSKSLELASCYYQYKDTSLPTCNRYRRFCGT